MADATTGTPQATVHDTFRKRLEDLRTTAGKQAAAVKGDGARPWQVPDGIKDLLDIAKLHEPAFNRDEINKSYQECMQDADNLGTTADVIALKQQVDYVAMEERAFRLRHATIVRCLIHGAGRRYGDSISRTYPSIEKQVSDIIACGGA